MADDLETMFPLVGDSPPFTQHAQKMQERQRASDLGRFAGVLEKLPSDINMDTGYWVVRAADIEALAARLQIWAKVTP
jgi:hypothetical protein